MIFVSDIEKLCAGNPTLGEPGRRLDYVQGLAAGMEH